MVEETRQRESEIEVYFAGRMMMLSEAVVQNVALVNVAPVKKKKRNSLLL